jgi:hypothetical protein
MGNSSVPHTELLEVEPGYVPSGYRLTSRLCGVLFSGFRGGEEQIMLIYTRGWTDEVFLRPLTVHISPPANTPVLFGTEKRSGRELGAVVPDATVMYHDGRWDLGPGAESLDVGPVVVHWNRADEHSVTIGHPGVLYAIRGSRRNAVTMAELVRVGQSLPYPATTH